MMVIIFEYMPLFFMKKDVVIDKVGDQLVIVKKERHSQNKYILEQKFRKNILFIICKCNGGQIGILYNGKRMYVK